MSLLSSCLSVRQDRNTDGRTEYVAKYATKEQVDDAGDNSEDSDEMSSVGSFDEDEEDEEPAGAMEEV